MVKDLDDIKTTLVDLEKGFWKAAGSDGAYYNANFADDGLLILPFPGGILNKEKAIEAVRQSEAWAAYVIDNPRLLSISDLDIAVVYEATGKRYGQPDYRALVCSIYRQLGDRWQLVLHQQTPIEG